jgi:predicted RNA-binding protein with RPS1 domain
MLKSEIVSQREFEVFFSRWLPTIQPKQAVLLLEAGVVEWSSFETCISRWTTEADVSDAQRLISAGYLDWRSFQQCFTKWAKQATPNDASVLVASGAMSWSDFNRPKVRRPQTGTQVKGLITRVEKYGTLVELGGARGLVTNRETDLKQGEVNKSFDSLGTLIDLVILGMDESKDRISLRQRKSIKTSEIGLRIGDVINGKIKSIAAYGIFVELTDNLVGLAHKSEIAWTKTNDLSEFGFSSGQSVDVKVVNIDSKGLISLSLKQLIDVTKLFPVGTELSGTITGESDKRFFVSVAPGVKGTVLKNINGLGDTWRKRKDSLKVGEQLKVKVSGFDMNYHFLKLKAL